MSYNTPSWTERLILANQYEILSVLHKNESFALMAESFRAGHEWLYKKCFDQFLDNMPSDHANHVVTILYLYELLQSSYSELKDKSGIDVDRLCFPGFDFHDENELFVFAEALLKRGFYENTIGTEVKRASGTTTEMYQRMIQAKKKIVSQRPLDVRARLKVPTSAR
jgi:hypothetical protein